MNKGRSIGGCRSIHNLNSLVLKEMMNGSTVTGQHEKHRVLSSREPQDKGGTAKPLGGPGGEEPLIFSGLSNMRCLVNKHRLYSWRLTTPELALARHNLD